MKKVAYTFCGTILILTAAILRTTAGGGGETFALALLGLLLIIASADAPQKRGVQ